MLSGEVVDFDEIDKDWVKLTKHFLAMLNKHVINLKENRPHSVCAQRDCVTCGICFSASATFCAVIVRGQF